MNGSVRHYITRYLSLLRRRGLYWIRSPVVHDRFVIDTVPNQLSVTYLARRRLLKKETMTGIEPALEAEVRGVDSCPLIMKSASWSATRPTDVSAGRSNCRAAPVAK